jgi:nucleotide-binding universal stress UspA family protein
MHGDSMRNRIVCGIDASPASATAAQVAAQLGTRLGSEIVLVHAEPVRRGSGRTPAGIAHARERGRLHALAEAHGLGAGSRVEILDGEPEAELVRAAEAHAAEFLIVGSHASPSSEAALGRVTGAVLRRAPCPVIVVPPHAPRRRGAPGTYAVMCSLDETSSGWAPNSYPASGVASTPSTPRIRMSRFSAVRSGFVPTCSSFPRIRPGWLPWRVAR